MYLCFENIPRTGALANITCQEYLNATDSVGSYKVAVLDLKTLATFESCVPVFTSALYEEPRVFCHQFRNSLEGIDTNRHDDKFFMSWSGKRVSSPMVSVQLNSFWGKVVGHTKERPRISATLVRKSVVSKVHTQKLELGKDLAGLMCHSEDTAKRSYFFQEKNKKAGTTSATLRSVLLEDGKATSDVDKEKDVVRRYFKDDIERKKITIAIVREKNAKFQQYSNAQLRDKVRYMIQRSEKSEGTVFLLLFCYKEPQKIWDTYKSML